MRQLAALFVMAFALFALATPSVAAAARASMTDTVALASQDGSRLKTAAPCPHGVARVLPCQPDVAPPAGLPLAVIGAEHFGFPLQQDRAQSPFEPRLDLPPPRRS